jgi:tRNA A37 threonylcarbamoyladenosine modification protein TsaB
MKKTEYLASIDMTGPFSSWCIADGNKGIIAKESVKVSRKSNSVFFDTFRKKLKALDLDFKDISKWYVGVGPGSYTGIRVGAAFVSGILFCNDEVNVVGVPSYFPITAELKPKENEKIGVVFQVTHKSILIYNIFISDGVLSTDDSPVLYDETNIHEVSKKYDRLVSVVEFDKNQLVKGTICNDIKQLDSFPVERMFDDECCANCREIDDMIYTRPPVTTVPQK